MSEEANDGGGKKKSPGKILGILGLVFGLVGLICGIIAYMALPSAGEVDSLEDMGSALGGGLSLVIGGFCAWVAIILAVIGLIIALVKKAESKGMVFVGLIVAILAYVMVWMATPAMPDAGDWGDMESAMESAMEDAMEDAMDDLGH